MFRGDRDFRGRSDCILEQLKFSPEKFSFTKAVDFVVRYLNFDVGDMSGCNIQNINIKSRCNFQSKFSDIYEIEGLFENNVEIITNMQGIVGIEGTLPDCYAEEYILDNRNMKDSIFEFFDIFNHRMLSMRYIFEKKQVVRCLSVRVKNSVIGKIISSLSGFDFQDDSQFLENSLIPDQFKISSQWALWRNTRSSYILKIILSNFFDVKVDIEQFVGGFTEEISRDECSLLGRQYNSLGIDFLLGRKVWDDSMGIKINIGPLNFDQYISFLPKRSKFDEKISILEKLKSIIRVYVPYNIRVMVLFYLGEDYVRGVRLNDGKQLNKDTFVMGNHISKYTHFKIEI